MTKLFVLGLLLMLLAGITGCSKPAEETPAPTASAGAAGTKSADPSAPTTTQPAGTAPTKN